jgi:hypothetical protein
MSFSSGPTGGGGSGGNSGAIDGGSGSGSSDPMKKAKEIMAKYNASPDGGN